MNTPRERLEHEVRITARKNLTLRLESDSGKSLRTITVKPFTFASLQDIGKEIAILFSKFLSLSTSARVKATADVDVVRSELEGGQVSPSSPDDDLFDPDKLLEAGLSAKDVIAKVIETGTDVTWDDVEDLDFQVVIHIVINVLKFNLGPELRAFLTEELMSIGKIFGVEAATTDVKPSSSDEDTPSATSDDSPSESSSVD